MALKLHNGKLSFNTYPKKYWIHTREGEITKMSAKPKIKLIKKGTVRSIETPVIVEKKAANIAAREMVSTVTTWVSDFQQKRREETKQAFEMLFQNKPQTNGV